MNILSVNRFGMPEEEVVDLRPKLSGSFEVIHKNLTDGLKLLLRNPSQYARELNTVDYIANLISSIKPLKSELQFNQDLTNLLYQFSNEATPCVS